MAHTIAQNRTDVNLIHCNGATDRMAGDFLSGIDLRFRLGAFHVIVVNLPLMTSPLSHDMTYEGTVLGLGAPRNHRQSIGVLSVYPYPGSGSRPRGGGRLPAVRAKIVRGLVENCGVKRRRGHSRSGPIRKPKLNNISKNIQKLLISLEFQNSKSGKFVPCRTRSVKL